MAIEFNCPYCSALIRVPDNAAGGKGKCPRCARRITVPKVSSRTAPKPPSPEIAALFEQSEPEPAASQDDDPNTITFAEAEPEFDPDAPFDVLAPRALGQLPVEPIRRPLAPGSISSKLKRTKSGAGWLIPIGFGLLLCGVVGWYVWQQYETERLSGELVAETAPVLELPAAEVDRALFKQSPDEMKHLLAELEKNPVRIPSTLMLVQVGGTKRAVTFRINAGTQTVFYRVDIQNDPGIISYRKKHTLDLEQLRESELEQAGTDFMTEYQRVIEKKAGPGALSEFRNSFALPALTRGLGHQVVAAYGQTVYQCVYEDRDGGLYFLLPPGAQGFEIMGRKHKDGKVVFPGKYQVKVGGELKTPSKDKSESVDKKKTKKTESMDDGDKAEMKEPMEDGDMKKSMKETQ